MDFGHWRVQWMDEWGGLWGGWEQEAREFSTANFNKEWWGMWFSTIFLHEVFLLSWPECSQMFIDKLSPRNPVPPPWGECERDTSSGPPRRGGHLMVSKVTSGRAAWWGPADTSPGAEFNLITSQGTLTELLVSQEKTHLVLIFWMALLLTYSTKHRPYRSQRGGKTCCLLL